MEERLISILQKVVNGAALSEDEMGRLNRWLEESPHNRTLYEELKDPEIFQRDVKTMLAYDSTGVWNKVIHQINPGKSRSHVVSIFRRRRLWYAAAAILLISISATVYTLSVKPTSHLPSETAHSNAPIQKDFLPGKEQAILTLDDGTKLELNNTSNGKIAQQGNTVIVKEDGLLAYNPNGKQSKANSFNTLTIPRAGYYPSLVLADGSKIWVNSESSITYPTSFSGKERVVEITGEVYFEVAKNPSKPFKVKVKDKDMTVEVLGTHFNVNAYGDEGDIKTTLLEGSVKISANKKTKLLVPGQQSTLGSNGDLQVTNDVDVDEVVAWKNGVFAFKKQGLDAIMRQVSRWYGVDVAFEDKISGHFVATVPRSVSVSKLLQIFEAMGEVKFEIDQANKKIIVRR